MQFGIAQIPSFFMVCIRQTTAGVILLCYIKFYQTKSIKFTYTINDLLPGILMVGLGNGCITASVRYLPTSAVSILAALIPIWVFILSLKLNKFSFKRDLIRLAGVSLGFFGVYVMSRTNDINISPNKYLGGVFIAILGTLLWAAGLVLNRKIVAVKQDYVLLTSYQLLAGGLTLLPIGMILEDYSKIQFHLQSIFAISYLVIFCSVIGFVAYNNALRALDTITVSLANFIIPLLSTLIGILFANEAFTWSIGLAGILITSGCVVITIERRIPYE